MGFRFQKRITLFPGLRLNLSKSGVSMSAGPRGASVTVGKNGVYGNVGIPGSGLSWRERLDKPSGRSRSRNEGHREQGPCEQAPSLPPMPTSAQARLVGNGIEIVDGYGDPIHPAHLSNLKAQMRHQIRDFLQANAIARNEATEALRRLHHDIPRSVAPAKPSGAGKPQSHDYPCHGEFMEALMKWRADQANSRSDDSGVAEAVLNALGALDWPAETNIALDASNGRLLLDVDLPEIEDMPTARWNSVISRMELAEKAMSQKDIAGFYLDHVSSVIVRLIGHSFASSSAIRSVALSAYTQRKTATGRLSDEYVATVSVTREAWGTVEVSQIHAIDPHNLLRHLGANIDTNARGVLLVQTPLS
ncbi:DUF4236 domain-containing protein [Novosphingobium sp.]|uniref:DUF4236 domain-containing protein n=1 Tax=Novosphingobium sp. TaxID=1874826 RepID=UPI0038BA0269